MAKKKYVKPMMVSEEFVSDSYCAVCNWTHEDMGTLYAKCEGANVTIAISGYDQYGDPMSGQGESGIQGQLMRDKNEGEWIFAGTLNPGHNDNNRTGEFYPIGSLTGQINQATNQSYKVGDTYGNYEVCAHEFGVTAAHHHLTNGRIVYKNQS